MVLEECSGVLLQDSLELDYGRRLVECLGRIETMDARGQYRAILASSGVLHDVSLWVCILWGADVSSLEIRWVTRGRRLSTELRLVSRDAHRIDKRCG